jgi:hypothetical protein
MKRVLMSLCVAMMAGAALATVPSTDQYLPALGHAFGAADVNGVRPWWRGDVWVFNPSSTQSATVTIFLLRRQANPSPESRVITVDPGDTRYLPDVILGTFGYDNLYAGLRLLSSIPVLVTAESYDANVTVVNKVQGTAGQFFAALPADLALGLGEASDLPGFDQDATGTSGLFRSNLAVVETTGNAVNYNLQIYDGASNLVGTKAYSLGAREVGQINYVVTDVTGGTGTNERVHLVVTGGTGKVIAVGSRIDNRTGDPSTIDMVAIHQSGQFEGVVLDAATGAAVDGGLQLVIGNGALTTFQGVAGIPCGTDSFTLDFSPVAAVNVAIAANGTFTTSVSIPYGDSTTTLFTTNWTVAGARGADGTWSGTLTSDTTGGVNSGGYNYATCNALGVTRQWRAAWTGGNS